MTLPKTYLSPSQINMFLRCPAQYYFRYIEGKKLPPKSSMTKGKAVHSGVEFNYRQKKETRQDLPIKEVLEYTAATFEEYAAETAFEGKDKGKEKDSTIQLTKCYQTEIAPTVQPVYIEEKVEISFDNTDYDLLGVIDLIDETKQIRDTKTSARTPSEKDIQNSLQLSAYSIMYRTLTGEEETGISLDYVVATKTPKTVRLQAQRTEEDRQRFLRIMGIIAHNIKCKNFYPNPTNFMCSPNNCGYWDECQKVF